jgi:NADPH:quinone reductase-like Zn-dependent oxidoreductase
LQGPGFLDDQEPGGPSRTVEQDLAEPGRGQVRTTVEACGVCRSDVAFVGAAFPNVPFPLVTGHEIAGRIEVRDDALARRTPRACRRDSCLRRPGGRVTGVYP